MHAHRRIGALALDVEGGARDGREERRHLSRATTGGRDGALVAGNRVLIVCFVLLRVFVHCAASVLLSLYPCVFRIVTG